MKKLMSLLVTVSITLAMIPGINPCYDLLNRWWVC